ncbi:hypothetical protein ACTWQF_30765 [Streptomyces sp. 8N114]|uniref:hypothetical protein n=1 Tax=Streptomyces sp. 8N114 TaxID=3457419 RepID=UPI003FCFAF84
MPQWTQRSRRALAEVRHAPQGTIRPEAVALREAFDLAATGRTSAAADRVQPTGCSGRRTTSATMTRR